MTFTVIDTKTGQYPDTWEIACKEEWAKCLCYCDIEGFAVEEDGTLVLLDECGKVAYCPEGRFQIVQEGSTMTNQVAMSKLPPEEFYRKMYWLMFKYGCQFNNTELAVIDWLKQEAE